ncbi:MAG TPA: hypothetical protein VK421_17665 [Pyrinomonadaceae bacterium]|nr:hypothetical protein [Pyrinomonadaceae bacterium]
MRSAYARLSSAVLVALVAAAGLGPSVSPSSAQQQRPQPTPTPAHCPAVRVTCPDSSEEGTEPAFTADVSGGDQGVTPTFNWTVSAGTISSGQGTSTIRVDTTGAGGQTVTATVDVGGFARDCATSASCTVSITKKGPPAVKFGEYATPDLSANKAQLDKWVRALELDPAAQGYLIAYGGRTSQPDDAQKAADNATDYTINVRKMDGARTLSGVGGYREQPTVELWIAPAGGLPPMATPTVDPKDVKTAPARTPAKPAAKTTSKKS